MRKKHLKVSQPFYKKRRFWILLFFILFVFFSLAFFLFSEQFYLKTLEIVCKEPISNKEKIENFIFTFFSENFLKKPHLFLKSTKNLEKAILQQNPEIETIVFSRKIPSKLIVTIKKREEVLVFCQENSCFSVDKNGIVFATSSANGAFVVESQDVSGEIVLGEKIFSQETITKILQIENEIFSKNFVPLSAKLSKNKAEFF
ncbi:hypothetical protein H5T58_03260, partial [Candidatus Parcubacteria bacterium]|nr:hypothetical protein [Candidatus Parcubacteria bacterium]